MELALDPASSPANGEAAHLARCEQCAAIFAEERRITEELLRIEADEPPAGFTADALARFRRETTRTTTRNIIWSVAGLTSILIPLIVLVAANGSEVLGAAVSLAGDAIAVASAVATVASVAPAVTLSLVVLACLVGLAASLALARLSKSPSTAKYLHGGGVPRGGEAR